MNKSLLIELVKSHEELYNTNYSGYRSAKIRYAAWTEISEKCGATPEECTEAWRKLRNSFTNAKKRRQKSSQDLGRWRFEDKMSFLTPYIKELPSIDNPDIEFVEDSWESPGSSISTSSKIVSTERELLLINLIRRYEVLYNTKCKEYTNLRERYAAWSEIADLHGSSVNQCKKTWVKLRNCYTKSMRRRERNKKSKKLPMIAWRFQKEMSFLRPYMHRRSDTENMKTSYEEDIWNLDNPENSVARKRKANAEYLDVSDGEEDRAELMFPNEELDDVDHFFLSMSKMTKKLPEIDQLRIKLELHKSITEAELKYLEKNYCSKKTDQTSVKVKLENLNPDYTYEVLEEFNTEDYVEGTVKR